MQPEAKKYSKGKLLGMIAGLGTLNVLICVCFWDWVNALSNALFFYIPIFLFVAIAKEKSN